MTKNVLRLGMAMRMRSRLGHLLERTSGLSDAGPVDRLVKLAVFETPERLAVLRSRLESEGIPCFVQDEHTIQVYNFLSNALGGVKLYVRESDLQAAAHIIKDTGYNTEPDTSHPKLLQFIERWLTRLGWMISWLPASVKPEQRLAVLLIEIAMVLTVVVTIVLRLLT